MVVFSNRSNLKPQWSAPQWLSYPWGAERIHQELANTNLQDWRPSSPIWMLFKYIFDWCNILISMHIPVIFPALAERVLQHTSCSLTEIRWKRKGECLGSKWLQMSSHKKPLSRASLIFTMSWKPKHQLFHYAQGQLFISSRPSGEQEHQITSEAESSKTKWLCNDVHFPLSEASPICKKNSQSHPTTIWRKIWLTAVPLPPFPRATSSPKSISTQVRQQLVFQSCYFKVCLWVLMSS